MKTNYEHTREKTVRTARETSPGLSADYITGNSLTIVREMNWLEELLDHRIKELLDPESRTLFFSEHPPPDLANKDAPYASLAKDLELGPAERLLLICSLVPHFAP